VVEGANRLIQIETSTTTITFSYDYRNYRTKKSTPNGTTYFFYDKEGKLIREVDENGTELAYYIYTPSGKPLATIQNGNTYYYHTDGKGDIIALTDEQGNIVKTYTYDPWGNIISEEGTSTLKNPFTYKGAFGYYYDEETGLYYLKARYYDPKIYRFISRDPIEKAPELADLQNPLSLNPYVYCENNPVNKVDPDGYISVWLLAKILAYAVIGYYTWRVCYHLRYCLQYKKGIIRACKSRKKYMSSYQIMRIILRTWHGRMLRRYVGYWGMKLLLFGARGG